MGHFQVFADTIVGCTVTALCILASGVLNSGLTGVALSTQAFSSVFGKMGGVFVAVSIVMFAFATLVSWSYYGEKSLEYLAGERLIPDLSVPLRRLRRLGLYAEPGFRLESGGYLQRPDGDSEHDRLGPAVQRGV